MSEALKNLPVVKLGWPWKAAFEMRKDPVGFLKDNQKSVGNIYRVDAPIPFVVLSNHEHIRHVLQVNWRNYRKGPAYESFALMLGNGLLNSEGEEWKRHRKLIQPGFSKDHVQSLANSMTETAFDFLSNVTSKNSQAEQFELKSAMFDLSMEVIARVMMGAEISAQYRNKLLPLIHEQYAFVMQRNRTFFRRPLWLPTHANLSYHKAIKELDKLVYEIIDLKKDANDGTLLSMMMQSTYDDGSKLSRSELRDEFLTLFVTGFETTATAMSWTLMLLAKLPEIQQKLFDEIKIFDRNQHPSVTTLMQCVYLNAVIKESLRLFPPVWVIARKAIAEDNIGGYRIPKKAHIFMSVLMSHSDVGYWDQPEEFRPERFIGMKENPAYMPFGVGARMCIGNHFSHIEMLTSLFAICSRYRVEMAQDRGFEIEPRITMQPKGDVMVKLLPRD